MRIGWGWLRSKRVWLLVSIVLFVVVLLNVLPLPAWLGQVQRWLQTLGPWAGPMFIGIYVGTTIFGLPNAILMLIAGTLFGLLPGTIYASIADTIGAVACFLLGRTIARKRVKALLARNPALANLDQALAQKGWKLILLTRLSPVVPSNVLNYGFGCTKVNFWQYSLFSWLGMIPVIFLYVYLGSFGAGFFRSGSSQQLIPQTFGLLATIGLAIYTTRFAKAALAQAANQPQKTLKEPSKRAP